MDSKRSSSEYCNEKNDLKSGDLVMLTKGNGKLTHLHKTLSLEFVTQLGDDVYSIVSDGVYLYASYVKFGVPYIACMSRDVTRFINEWTTEVKDEKIGELMLAIGDRNIHLVTLSKIHTFSAEDGKLISSITNNGIQAIQMLKGNVYVGGATEDLRGVISRLRENTFNLSRMWTTSLEMPVTQLVEVGTNILAVSDNAVTSFDGDTGKTVSELKFTYEDMKDYHGNVMGLGKCKHVCVLGDTTYVATVCQGKVTVKHSEVDLYDNCIHCPNMCLLISVVKSGESPSIKFIRLTGNFDMENEHKFALMDKSSSVYLTGFCTGGISDDNGNFKIRHDDKRTRYLITMENHRLTEATLIRASKTNINVGLVPLRGGLVFLDDNTIVTYTRGFPNLIGVYDGQNPVYNGVVKIKALLVPGEEYFLTDEGLISPGNGLRYIGTALDEHRLMLRMF